MALPAIMLIFCVGLVVMSLSTPNFGHLIALAITLSGLFYYVPFVRYKSSFYLFGKLVRHQTANDFSKLFSFFTIKESSTDFCNACATWTWSTKTNENGTFDSKLTNHWIHFDRILCPSKVMNRFLIKLLRNRTCFL